MITDGLKQAQVISVLSERFCMSRDDDGQRWIACDGILLDYNMFCTFMIWYLGDRYKYYSSIIQLREDYLDKLRLVNNQNDSFSALDNRHLIDRLWVKFINCLEKYEKESLVEEFNTMITSQ